MFKHRWLFVLLLLAGIMTLSLPAHAQKEFGKWPAGTSPREVGKRVAEHFATTPFVTTHAAAQPAYINYPDSVAWYGALTFAQLSGAAADTSSANSIRTFISVFDGIMM